MIVVKLYVNPACPHCEALLEQVRQLEHTLPPDAKVVVELVGSWHPRFQLVPPVYLPPHKQNWVEDTVFRGEPPMPRDLPAALGGRQPRGAAAELARRAMYGTPQVEVEFVRPAPGGRLERRAVVFTGWSAEEGLRLLSRLAALAWLHR